MTETSSIYSISAGNSGSPMLTLTALDGARAEIYLHGGHVTSWVPAGGEERLFLSSSSAFGPNSSIRGGVPVIFPQFSNEGPLPKHGFVRRMDWQFVQAHPAEAGVTAILRLQANDESRRIWPFEFLLELAITLGGAQLELALNAANPGTQPFSFTAALHTYLRVADIHTTALGGLGGLPYLDKTGQATQRVQPEGDLRFTSEVDRIYYAATGPLTVREEKRSLQVTTSGFTDTVVWNPWAALNQAMADLEPEGYRRMVCVEAVTVGQPVILRPAQRWQGIQRLTA